jgi:hypothetical protein
MKNKAIYPSVPSTTLGALVVGALTASTSFIASTTIASSSSKADTSSPSAFSLPGAPLNSCNARYWLSVTFPYMSITTCLLVSLNRIEVAAVSVFDFQKHLMSAACDAAYFHIF